MRRFVSLIWAPLAAGLTACGGDITDPQTTTHTGSGGAPACSSIEPPKVARRLAAYGNRARAIDLGAAGELLFTGSFIFVADFGSDPGPGLVKAVGNEDAFVMALDPSGATSWFRSFGRKSNSVSGTSISVGPGGNLAVAGSSDYLLDLGGGEVCDPTFADQVFVTGLSPKGDHVYSLCFGSDAQIEGAPRVVMDDEGNTVVAVAFSGAGMSIGKKNLWIGGGTGIAVAKLDAKGSILWAKALGGSGAALDVSGFAVSGTDVVLSGYLGGTADFGNGPLKGQAEGFGNTFIVKLDGSGSALWSKAIASTTSQFPRGLAVGPDGRVAVMLEGWASLSFGGPAVTSNGARDVFLATFDEGGKHLWSKAVGSAVDDEGVGVAWASDGTVSVVLSTYEDIDPGCGKLTVESSTSFILARFNVDGYPLGARHYRHARGDSVAARGGRTAMTGYVEIGELDLGAGNLPGEGGVVVAAWGE